LTNPTNQGVRSDQNPSKSGLAEDKGDLKLNYQPRKNVDALIASQSVGTNSQAIEQVIANLNERVALPWDIVISFEDCESPDASYDPETRGLRICYQLIDEYYDLFARKLKDKARLDDAVRGAVASTFFHELGHALVDAWQLPITGKEEDAVDQLSTLVLINHTDKGEQMALDGAVTFALYAELDKNQKKLFWDEHSLDEQRFFDNICLIYGHNREKFAYLVSDGILPEERAELCSQDYPRVARSWRTLLSPYLKKPPSTEATSASPGPS